MKATKLTEKIFTIYDDTKAAQKSKKRSHPEDKDKDKDAKKSRFRDDETKTEKSTETQLSADKVKSILKKHFLIRDKNSNLLKFCFSCIH
jgi:hypothetical protein